MNNENQKIVCDKIVDLIPEFQEYKDFSLWDRGNPYLFLGVFTQFLLERIRSSFDSDSVIQRVFNFINNEFDQSQDNDVLTLLHVEIFEGLAISKKGITMAQIQLKGKALEDFSKMLPHFDVGVKE